MDFGGGGVSTPLEQLVALANERINREDVKVVCCETTLLVHIGNDYDFIGLRSRELARLMGLECEECGGHGQVYNPQMIDPEDPCMPCPHCEGRGWRLP